MKSVKAIAIGGFDGMHVGHQQLFEALGETGGILEIETGYANLTPAKAREHYSDLPIFYYELDDIRHLDAKGFIARLLEEFPDEALSWLVFGVDGIVHWANFFAVWASRKPWAMHRFISSSVN